MKFGKSLLTAAVAATVLAIGAAPAQAQVPGSHPAYVHALQDLRLMRAYIVHLEPGEQADPLANSAMDLINAAIKEIAAAAISDGKDPNYLPPIDAHIRRGDRMRKAREAGQAAWRDINREEDNTYANGLKDRALDHLSRLNGILDQMVSRYQ